MLEALRDQIAHSLVADAETNRAKFEFAEETCSAFAFLSVVTSLWICLRLAYRCARVEDRSRGWVVHCILWYIYGLNVSVLADDATKQASKTAHRQLVEEVKRQAKGVDLDRAVPHLDSLVNWLIEERLVTRKDAELRLWARRLHYLGLVLDILVPPCVLLIPFALGASAALHWSTPQWEAGKDYGVIPVLFVSCVASLCPVLIITPVVNREFKQRSERKVASVIEEKVWKRIPHGVARSLLFLAVRVTASISPKAVEKVVITKLRKKMSRDSIERARRGEVCTIVYDFVRSVAYNDKEVGTATDDDDDDEDKSSIASPSPSPEPSDAE